MKEMYLLITRKIKLMYLGLVLKYSVFIIWLCLTRTGNYQIHEFDWLNGY